MQGEALRHSGTGHSPAPTVQGSAGVPTPVKLLPPGRVLPIVSTTPQQLQHLYWRAGFGPRPQDVAAGHNPRQALRQLLKDSEKYEPLTGPGLDYHEPEMDLTTAPATPAAAPANPVPTDAVTTPDQPAAPGQLLSPVLRKGMTAEQLKAKNRGIREAFINMSTAWMTRMATSPAQLREKMTLFWHGHFACRVRRPDAALSLHNTMRKHALGKFPDLLRAVSQEAAMLQFLNNQQNRKEHANENFAREVMELFTLGRGNYTETDVKEAARAFTGWGYDRDNTFRFRERQHDAGSKTFLGQTGNFTGDDVLRIILQQPAAATFLVTKIYRFFVNDTPDPARIAPLAASFRKSGYDVAALLEDIFSANWFYDPANVGSHIKSPVELLAGLRRTLNLKLDRDAVLLGYQKALGQTLFQPPNVAGWPGGRNWIDSSSLLLRLQLPAILFKNADFAVALKQDENDLAPNLSRGERLVKNDAGAHLPLAPLQALLAGATPAETPARLAAFLLQAAPRPESLALVQQGGTELRGVLIGLLSLPEYQLA